MPVLQALKSRGDVYRIDGGMAELDEILEDDFVKVGDALSETIREIFVTSGHTRTAAASSRD